MAILRFIARLRRPARITLACAFALVLILGFASGACAQQSVKETELRAAFVFQFANYVQWPDAALPDASTPITIGVVANEGLFKTLTASVRGKTIGGRAAKVVEIKTQAEAEACQVLYIDSKDDKRVSEVLDYVRAKPVLSVSDDDNFTSEGGIIRLFQRDNKLRFEINVDEAARSGLSISSKLLDLAQIVRDKT